MAPVLMVGTHAEEKTEEIPVSTVSTPVASGGQDLGGRSRFAKLGMATNDALNQAYRDILEMEVPPSDIESKAKAVSVYKRLRPEQEHILLDAKHSGYKNFDISLLYTLIRNICSTIPKPTKGKWGDNNMPAAGEISVGDDIERIRLIRNSLTAHVSSASTPQKEFDDTWSMMSDVCQRLEAFTGKKYIDSLKGVQKLVLKEEGEDGIKAIIEKFAKDQHEQHELLKTVVSDVQELKTNMQQVKDITKYWNREQQQENLDKDGSPVNTL
ncbi:uncharacterized protein LOC134243629 [Saccostrea cucullata]|uniref:uncharacterized protein LOC134243629 n=1 Tax=Saccostrea cuccullata TaxID=36930 RepID=UPI002ED580A7